MSNTIPPGWVGGFPQSNPAFAYPKPDLSSLPILDNMANIDKLQRQQKVLWPEFSWDTEPDQTDKKRCFQMFAPDISRVGYTDEGRVYSIICPQQGVWIKNLLCLNVEVTVTGQRGWVDEPKGQLAADMTVEGKIWFTPKGYQSKLVQILWAVMETLEQHHFPLSKDRAIRVKTFLPGNPAQSTFPLLDGETSRFSSPDFTKHQQEAYAVGNIDVEIGDIHKTGDQLVDDFNELIMLAFNDGSGNMLKQGNVLSWNVWFNSPELVNTQEWRDHAEKWRESIDAHHGSPEGEGTSPRFADGTYFKPKLTFGEALGLIEELSKIVFRDLLGSTSPGCLGTLKNLLNGSKGGTAIESIAAFGKELLERRKGA
jgi:hypothetical protein